MSSDSTGGDWKSTLSYIIYNPEPIKNEYKKEELLNIFKLERTNDEKILTAKIWKYPLARTLIRGLIGDWHEYVVIKSTNWYWSFEKQMDGIYVQRSSKKLDVKENFHGNPRTTRTIEPEGRSEKSVRYNETIYNTIEWIFNNDELDNTYDVTQSNCHFFASELYEAVVRSCGKRLDDTDAKSRIGQDDPLRILRPFLRSVRRYFSR